MTPNCICRNHDDPALGRPDGELAPRVFGIHYVTRRRRKDMNKQKLKGEEMSHRWRGGWAWRRRALRGSRQTHGSYGEGDKHRQTRGQCHSENPFIFRGTLLKSQQDVSIIKHAVEQGIEWLNIPMNMLSRHSSTLDTWMANCVFEPLNIRSTSRSNEHCSPEVVAGVKLVPCKIFMTCHAAGRVQNAVHQMNTKQQTNSTLWAPAFCSCITLTRAILVYFHPFLPDWPMHTWTLMCCVGVVVLIGGGQWGVV